MFAVSSNGDFLVLTVNGTLYPHSVESMYIDSDSCSMPHSIAVIFVVFFLFHSFLLQMVSSTRTVVFEHSPNGPTTITSRVICHEGTPMASKKRNSVTKEITLLNPGVSDKTGTVAVPKSIEFPTPSTPIRYYSQEHSYVRYVSGC